MDLGGRGLGVKKVNLRDGASGAKKLKMHANSKRSLVRTSIIIIFIAIFLLGIYYFIGRPMIAFVGDVDAFRAYVEEKGILAYLVFGLFVFFQTLSNCIPGLPFYLTAGFILGGVKGAILCDLFATLGNTAAFLIGKKFGRSFLLYLFPEDKLTHVEELIFNKNPILVHIMFMFLPLPKDTYAWLGFYSGENVIMWLLITFVARFPHIFLYTFSAEKMIDQQYGLFVLGAVIAVLVYLVVVVYLKKNKEQGKGNN